ncbi:MAG: hypothetical protein RL385_2829 [Pseudomonadota bacterium]
MPVEAIHISTFQDSFARLRLPAVLRHDRMRDLGRMGSLVIDFPYFDRYPVGVARYLLKLPTAVSHWGGALHHGDPSLMARAILDHAKAHLRTSSERGAKVLAVGLGFVSHLAVDATMHPFVNRLARARAARLGDSPLRQHSEIEKFQSVLFHEARNGFDFMGTKALGAHIQVPTAAAYRDDAIFEALCDGLTRAVGEAPSRPLLARWARGYAQHAWFIATPAGKLLVPESMKPRVREELFEGPWGTFQAIYDASVDASEAAMDAALAFVERDDEAALLAAVPQGPIDDLVPEPTNKAA